jgi:hypothetical protein
MNFRGYRKFSAFVMVLVAYTLIAWNNKGVDVFDLGLGLSFILGAFSGANAITHFTKGKGE